MQPAVLIEFAEAVRKRLPQANAYWEKDPKDDFVELLLKQSLTLMASMKDNHDKIFKKSYLDFSKPFEEKVDNFVKEFQNYFK
jgi:hypothetical protein